MNLKDIDFKLIEEIDGQLSVFIAKDEKAIELFNRYKNLPYTGIRRKIEFDCFRLEFTKYLLKVSRIELIKVISPYTEDIQLEKGDIFNLGEFTKEVYKDDIGLQLVEDFEGQDFFI